MKNSEYWGKRIANNTWKTYNSLEEKNRALLEMYQEASLNISDELYRVAEKMKTSTPTLSDMHKFNRLTNLQKNMENIIRELGENVEKFGKDNMIEGFKDIYSNVMAQLGITEFDMVPKKIMEEMLKRPWQGGTFSERLWKNTQVLAMNLNDIVTNGITQGKTVTEMAIQLNNAMNNGFNVSHRLVRTETMHYLNESAVKGYKDAGCEEVQLWAAVDERTCPTCGIKHGNIYRIKDRPVLPLHANCRCTYLPVVDETGTSKNEERISNTQSISDLNNYMSKQIYEKGAINNHIQFKIDEGMDLNVAKENVEHFMKLKSEYNTNTIYGYQSSPKSGATSGRFIRIGNDTGGVLEVSNQKKYITKENYEKKLKQNSRGRYGFDGTTLVNPENANIKITYHEFGHSFGVYQQRKFNKEAENFWAEIMKAKKDYTKNATENEIISDYASTSVDEFLAEAFTQAKLYDKPSQYALKVLNIVDKYFKKR
ncbi:MAG: minor capsid protein [Clostridium sp.]|uniref:minor capsid protein n=1 Tax=Clostridium sp. TaxID=1506 RepID=UPI002A8F4118|nr:minor capsid protein [Clostridium sp.]MDY5098623.1 minor capsid protein [Clostridium sp.]